MIEVLQREVAGLLLEERAAMSIPTPAPTEERAGRAFPASDGKDSGSGRGRTSNATLAPSVRPAAHAGLATCRS